MKALIPWSLSLGCILGLTLIVRAQPAAPPDLPVAPPDASEAPNPPPGEPEGEPAAPDLPEPADTAAPTESAAPAADTPSRPTAGAPAAAPSDARAPAAPNNLPTPPSTPLGDGERGLRLNFRGVPLDMVLNYLSDAAGFIINLETEVTGRVDVWSNQPLTKDEAITLLNTVLNKNGYAAIRNDRTLTIVPRDEAKKRGIPVISGSDPEQIPRSDEIVTQILPVRFISATQLVKDLQALLPPTASLSANEGGNSLVITDSQGNIRRMAEIVQALDQAISSVSAVRVFPLRFADAKALATTITQLFPSQDSSRNSSDPRARFMAQFRGPGGNAGGDNAAASANGGRVPAAKVIAVADERSNAVVVSAPDEQMLVIASVIQEVDTDVEDITELRVFRLEHADPQETADLLTNLFADSTTQQNSRTGGRFNFRGPGGGTFGMRGMTGTDVSQRTLQQTRVTAVPDLRTRSVVVSSSRMLMDQIGRMIEQLDADPARKQKVFVYSVENTDPQAVQEVIQSLFPEQNTGLNRNTRNTQRQNSNALNNRQTQNRNNTGRTGNTGLGNNRTGFGGN